MTHRMISAGECLEHFELLEEHGDLLEVGDDLLRSLVVIEAFGLDVEILMQLR